MKTLEQYLKDDHDRGVVDHSIRAHEHEGKVTFYIHPSGKDGDTLDFQVQGNVLIPGQTDEEDHGTS